jgi:hypothetical protein
MKSRYIQTSTSYSGGGGRPKSLETMTGGIVLVWQDWEQVYSMARLGASVQYHDALLGYTVDSALGILNLAEEVDMRDLPFLGGGVALLW